MRAAAEAVTLLAGNMHRYTIQCALPLNLWNEKIYMFLWYWMFIVATLNCVGFVNWFLCFVVPNDRVKFIENHLRAYGRLRDDGTGGAIDRERCRKFTREYLKQDGTFLLRLIAHNTNTVSTTEITCRLWDEWLKQPAQKQISLQHAYLGHDDDDDDAKEEKQPLRKSISSDE